MDAYQRGFAKGKEASAKRAEQFQQRDGRPPSFDIALNVSCAIRSIPLPPPESAEAEVPPIEPYLGREFQSLEEVLMVRPNWYLQKIASLIRPKGA